MNEELVNKGNKFQLLKADCNSCFALCCVALPYAQSADFARKKDGGTPCNHLESDYRCKIHNNLRTSGFKGCTVYECFGAGQKVSQKTFHGESWRESTAIAMEMFQIFPIMQQLHEMLYYIHEALSLEQARPLYDRLKQLAEETEEITNGNPSSLLELDVPSHRMMVSQLLLEVSELVRKNVKGGKSLKHKRLTTDFIGANFKRAILKGVSFRGAYLIAANLKEADLRMCDFLGADLRDADISGANLTGSIFLTQAQVNAAKGDKMTELPERLTRPAHWLSGA